MTSNPDIALSRVPGTVAAVTDHEIAAAERLARLHERQLRRHRVDPSRPVRGLKRAEAFIREQRLVLASARASVPALTTALAGAHLKGSWWSSGAPGTYSTLRGVVAAGVVSVPLILGKETLLDPALGPALERVASDEHRRDQSERRLPELARHLLRAVEDDGVRMDQWEVDTKKARPSRQLLELELLVWSEDLHTESGYHTAVVRPWATSPQSRRFRKQAKSMGWQEARDELANAALTSAVVAPEREAKRWFCFGAYWIDDAVNDQRAERLTVQGTTWLIAK